MVKKIKIAHPWPFDFTVLKFSLNAWANIIEFLFLYCLLNLILFYFSY